MKLFNLDVNNRFKYASTSDGEQLKWFKDNCFIKADTKGYESISEAFVSEFLKYVSDISFIDYKLCKIKEGKNEFFGCYSLNYCTSDIRLMSLYRFLQTVDFDLDVKLQNLTGKDLLYYILDSVLEYASIDIESYLAKICIIDYITCNTDRHLNNIFLTYNTKKDYFDIAPILDNGAALMSSLHFDLTKNQLYNKLSCKPFYSNFEEQINLFNNYQIGIDFNSFLSSLDSLYVEFKENEFNRAKEILLERLEKTRYILWYQKSC